MRASSLACMLVLGGALAQVGSGQADLTAETRLQVQRVVAQSSVALQAVEKLADDRERQLFDELAAKDRQLRRESGRQVCD